MTLSAQELTKLRLIISLAEEILAGSPNGKHGHPFLSNGNGPGMGLSVKRIRLTAPEQARVTVLPLSVQVWVPLSLTLRRTNVPL
jgi:hypothetical protein